MLQPSQPMRGRVWIFNTEGTQTRLVAILWQKRRCQMFPSEPRNGCDFAHHISQKQGKQLRQKVLRAIDRTRPFFPIYRTRQKFLRATVSVYSKRGPNPTKTTRHVHARMGLVIAVKSEQRNGAVSATEQARKGERVRVYYTVNYRPADERVQFVVSVERQLHTRP